MSLVILKESIAHAQIFSCMNTQDPGCIGGLLCPSFGSPSRSQFTLRKINDCGPFAQFDLIEQGTGATQFYIVRVNPKGQYIHFHIG
jgi:hypothetical protein